MTTIKIIGSMIVLIEVYIGRFKQNIIQYYTFQYIPTHFTPFIFLPHAAFQFAS